MDEVDQELAGLLKAAAGGDERAWREIVERYARRVYALARSRLGGSSNARTVVTGGWAVGNDEAEEVTQSVFCTIASKLASGDYTEQGRFEAWLFRVAMNRIRDEVRRRRRHAEATDPEAFTQLARGDDGAERSGGAEPEQLESLRRAMQHLSDADREVIELRHHAGLSFKQLGEMLDEPLGTLLARHHRALKKLKDLMSGGDGESDNVGRIA